MEYWLLFLDSKVVIIEHGKEECDSNSDFKCRALGR